MKNPLFYLLFVCSIFSCATVSAQKVIFDDPRGNKPLKWDDFEGKPDKSSPFKATTYYNVDWKMDTPAIKGDTAYCTISVALSLDEKCWVKKEAANEYILNHEQRHYDIARLWAAELCKTLRDTTYLKYNYRGVVYSISAALQSKYRLMQQQYDRETNHSIIEKEQERWNAVIDKELAVYYP